MLKRGKTQLFSNKKESYASFNDSVSDCIFKLFFCLRMKIISDMNLLFKAPCDIASVSLLGETRESEGPERSRSDLSRVGGKPLAKHRRALSPKSKFF